MTSIAAAASFHRSKTLYLLLKNSPVFRGTGYLLSQSAVERLSQSAV